MSQPIPSETWKEIPSCGGRYEVSDYGRVRSWYYRQSWQDAPMERKSFTSKVGYVYYRLTVDGVAKNYAAHRLVLYAFVGISAVDVNHIDGNKTNNHLSNLEYVTHKENHAHARNLPGRWQGKRELKPPTERDILIRKLAAEGVTQREIARQVGMSQANVQYIVSGKLRPSK